MKKQLISSRKIGAFPSPGTPTFRHAGVDLQKGWSSERIPLRSNANRRSINTPLLPYNAKALPSKWEDAERWIFSPLSGNDGLVRNSIQQQPQRRPKSKSGPLGPPGVAYYQMFSPAVGNNGKLIANSPLLTGIVGSNALSLRYECSEGGGSFITGPEPCMGRSISIHGCSEMHSQVAAVQGRSDVVKYDATNGDDDDYGDASNSISRAVSRRDMATQMSPESSPRSSSSSFSLATPNALPFVDVRSSGSSRLEITDASVEERVTMTRWSNKNGTKITGGGGHKDDDWKRKAMSIHSKNWEVATCSSGSISKVQREEAKITAWENLQKAKAEAAIRKLEMKLEKKRSTSMDKIMNKLRAAQQKAQEMRSSANKANHRNSSSSSDNRLSFRKTRQIGSLSGCFTCPAF